MSLDKHKLSQFQKFQVFKCYCIYVQKISEDTSLYEGPILLIIIFIYFFLQKTSLLMSIHPPNSSFLLGKEEGKWHMYNFFYFTCCILLIDILIDWCLTSSGKYFMHIRTAWVMMNESCFVLDRHTEPDFLTCKFTRQHSAWRHATLPIILSWGKPVFALTP